VVRFVSIRVPSALFKLEAFSPVNVANFHFYTTQSTFLLLKGIHKGTVLKLLW